MTITVDRPPMCACCLSTVARRGSLCHTCADEMDRADSFEFPVDNFDWCADCGGEVRRGFCMDCVAVSLRRTEVPA